MPTENSFVTGMKLEAVDKADPNLVRPATIYSTKGHRVRIRFVYIYFLLLQMRNIQNVCEEPVSNHTIWTLKELQTRL